MNRKAALMTLVLAFAAAAASAGPLDKTECIAPPSPAAVST